MEAYLLEWIRDFVRLMFEEAGVEYEDDVGNREGVQAVLKYYEGKAYRSSHYGSPNIG